MSWECLYYDEDFCTKRKKKCNPGDANCVLKGQVELKKDEDSENTTNSKDNND